MSRLPSRRVEYRPATSSTVSTADIATSRGMPKHSTAAATAWVAFPRLAVPGSFRASGAISLVGVWMPSGVMVQVGSGRRNIVPSASGWTASHVPSGWWMMRPPVRGQDTESPSSRRRRHPHHVFRFPRHRGDQHIVTVGDDGHGWVVEDALPEGAFDFIDFAHPVKLVPRQVEEHQAGWL